MVLQLKFIGVLLMGLALIHGFFPKYFHWKKEFAEVSLINRQMMYIHTLFIGIMVFLIGLLCVSSAEELVTTMLGHQVCLGICIFWFCRLVVQFVGYSPKLWKGKRFETFIHILFSILWLYLTTVFFLVFWN